MADRVLNIGFVLDDTLDTTDGVQQYVLSVGRWLSGKGHHVHYLVGQTSRSDISNVHSMTKNIKVRFNHNRLSIPLPANKRAILKKLAELKLDILHVQMPYSPLFAGKVINNIDTNVKVIGTFHIVPAGRLHNASSRGLKILNMNSVKRFNEIISVSTAAQSFAKDAFNIDSKVLPNVVDLEKFSHPAVHHNIPTVVFLGRLVERKGCRQLLNALIELQKDYTKPYNVIIAGAGPLKTELEVYAIKHNVKNVHFMGFVSEIEKPKLLAGADIAVFPSTGGESFGIVLIEAMAAGSRVVLGGNNVGYRTVLEDYPDLLFDPKKPKLFADRLKYYLDNPDAREQVRHWSKEHVKQYGVESVGKEILALYRKKNG